MASIGFESVDVHRLDAVVGEFLSETDRVFLKSDAALTSGRDCLSFLGRLSDREPRAKHA